MGVTVLLCSERPSPAHHHHSTWHLWSWMGCVVGGRKDAPRLQRLRQRLRLPVSSTCLSCLLPYPPRRRNRACRHSVRLLARIESGAAQPDGMSLLLRDHFSMPQRAANCKQRRTTLTARARATAAGARRGGWTGVTGGMAGGALRITLYYRYVRVN